MWRVDKATAVTGDIIRVGYHHIRRFAGHFVDDTLRFPARFQVRVILYQATKLRRIKLTGGIIENQPFLTDVVTRKPVMRNPGPVLWGDDSPHSR